MCKWSYCYVLVDECIILMHVSMVLIIFLYLYMNLGSNCQSCWGSGFIVVFILCLRVSNMTTSYVSHMYCARTIPLSNPLYCNYVWLCTYTFTHTKIWLSFVLWIYMYTHIHTYTYIHIYIYIYTYVYMYTYKYIYICIYVYLYI